MLPKRITKTPDGMKVCGKCQRELPKNNDFFDHASDREDGFRNHCKQCRRERRAVQQVKDTAELLNTLDLAVVRNLAESRPGGSIVPHAAEIYQSVMALMGGVQGFAMHWAGQYIAAKPGSQTRERMLAGMLKLSQALSDANKVTMPAEMLSEQELSAAIAQDELRIRQEERSRIVQGQFTDVSEAG